MTELIEHHGYILIYPPGASVALPTIPFDRNKSKRDDLIEEAKRMVDDHSSWPKQGPRGRGLKPRGHIHIVAIDVVAVDDDIAQVKADPEHDGFGLVAIGLGHGLLEVYGRGECITR
jgi:hypothetical protein